MKINQMYVLTLYINLLWSRVYLKKKKKKKKKSNSNLNVLNF